MKNQLPASSFQLSAKVAGILHALKAGSWQLAARAPSRRRGFTLIELLVVIAIIVLISAALLANLNSFGDQSIVQNLAYDMALTIRDAQEYGISVTKGSSSFGCSTAFQCGFGVNFNVAPGHYSVLGSWVPPSNTTYSLFEDRFNSGVYVTGEDLPPSPYTLNQGYIIYEVCYTNSSVETCSQTGTLNIVFIRPDPEACISWAGVPDITAPTGGGEQCNSTYTSARIVIASPNNSYESVIITATGVISVEQKGP